MIQDCIIQILLEVRTPSAMGLPVVFQTFLDYCQGWKAVYFVVLKLSQLILLLSCIPSPLTIKKVLSYPELESPFCKNSIHMKLVFFFLSPKYPAVQVSFLSRKMSLQFLEESTHAFLYFSGPVEFPQATIPCHPSFFTEPESHNPITLNIVI